uniref:Glycoside hydrolase family 38 central domain-containing protein n=1 Tax=Timema tahoe TaxID=61484 RepID=A0A7R9IA31_9NEOP|nr:unnamed protein product [Timema tahoe]
MLQVCKQLSVLGNVTGSDADGKLDDLRRAMGIMQHHDAITGTERQEVADDYIRMLTAALRGCEDVTKAAINSQLCLKVVCWGKKELLAKSPRSQLCLKVVCWGKKELLAKSPRSQLCLKVVNLVGNSSNLELKSCLLLNISLCEEMESSEDFLVTIYNPISHPVSQYVRLPVSGDSYIVTDSNVNISYPVSQYVRLPVSGDSYIVTDSDDESLVSQLVPIPQSVLDIPYRNSSALNELVFRATDLPPLGFTSYRVVLSTTSEGAEKTEESEDLSIDLPPLGFTSYRVVLSTTSEGAEKTEESEDLSIVQINSTSGLVRSISINGTDLPLQQSLLYYSGYFGDDKVPVNTSSGAYVFRPNSSGPVTITENVAVRVLKGPLVEEVHQVYNEWVSQVIRVYKEDNHVEFEWLVGPIPVNDGVGKEPVSRFTTNLESGGLFYTDANGRELQERRRDHRATWTWDVTEPAAGNYYPVTSRILLRDHNQGVELAVLNDRAQGGSSLQDGQVELMVRRDETRRDVLYLVCACAGRSDETRRDETRRDEPFFIWCAPAQDGQVELMVRRGETFFIWCAPAQDGQVELMVHRRLLHVQTFGQALNETAFGEGVIARGRHFVLAGRTSESEGVSLAAQERMLAQKILHPPWVFVSQATSIGRLEDVQSQQFSGLSISLPDNVNLLTLEPWLDHQLLVRLEHILESNEDSDLSQEVNIDLQRMLSTVTVSSFYETTIDGNAWLQEVDRLQWYIADTRERTSPERRTDNFTVTLSPMQIRTFLIQLQ